MALAGEVQERINEVVADWVSSGKMFTAFEVSLEVKKRGGRPLEPLAYKHEYHNRLMARIHGRLATLGLSAQISVPRESAARRGRERLTTLIRAGESPKIGAFPGTRTGDEKTHGLWRLLPLGERE